MYYINEQKIDATSMSKSNNALQESQTMCSCNQRACKSHSKVGYKVVAYIKSVCLLMEKPYKWERNQQIGSQVNILGRVKF